MEPKDKADIRRHTGEMQREGLSCLLGTMFELLDRALLSVCESTSGLSAAWGNTFPLFFSYFELNFYLFIFVT